MQTPTKIQLRHSTKPKYVTVFADLLQSGFNSHADCEFKRTDLLKILKFNDPKSEADKVHKALNQKVKSFCDQANNLATTKFPISIRVYKHLIRDDGWYFCLLLTSGSSLNLATADTTISKSEESTNAGSNYGMATGKLNDIPSSGIGSVDSTGDSTPVVSKVAVTPENYSDHDKEMIALYGDLYVPTGK